MLLSCLTDLPAELLVHILHHLPITGRIRAERVCTAMHQACIHTWNISTCSCIRLRTTIVNHDDDTFDSQRTTAILQRAAPHLQILTLDFPGPKDCHAQMHVQHFARKYELNFYIVSALVTCQRLTSLTITRHIFPCVAVWERLLQHLPPTLQHLSVTHCRLDAIQESDGLRAEHAIVNMWQRLGDLRTFEITGRGSCYGHLKLWSQTFDRAPNSLEHLDLSAGQAVQLADLNFVPRLRNLTTFVIQRSQIDEQDLKLLIDNCQLLCDLDLSYSRRISDFSVISTCGSRLRRLTLDGNRDYLNDTQFTLICAHCENLEKLSLESCTVLNSTGLQKICQLRALTDLSLNGLGACTDQVLNAICANCRLLQHLEIKFCRNLTSESLINLRHLTLLQFLGVSGVQAFDTDVLYTILCSSSAMVTKNNNTALRHLEAVNLKIDTACLQEHNNITVIT